MLTSLCSAGRLRVIIETDAGGDPDDEQSLVRFLLYANEWDVEGIIANRPRARDGENLNPKRTGLEIVQAMIGAYGQCYPDLILHDKRYPTLEYLQKRTVPGYNNTDDGVNLIIAAADSDDARPIWFCNWGTDDGAGVSSFRRALDKVLKERDPSGYGKFKNKFRLSSYNKFGDHVDKIDPPFQIWINTYYPEMNGRRWYHRFSPLTSKAGGFDLKRDLLTGHGPLGPLYPTNTGPPQKEGDTMTFLYLVPTGMNDPEEPTWGSWAGRYGLDPNFPNKNYYWANQQDNWHGNTNRDNTLGRWAADLQNDFRARLDWCVKDFAHANHPPTPKIAGEMKRTIHAGEHIQIDASNSTDPDGQRLIFNWAWYYEPGSYRGDDIGLENSTSSIVSFVAPRVESTQTLHLILTVTDMGMPPLARYQRVVFNVMRAGK